MITLFFPPKEHTAITGEDSLLPMAVGNTDEWDPASRGDNLSQRNEPEVPRGSETTRLDNPPSPSCVMTGNPPKMGQMEGILNR